jgi:hypothetical protein
MSERADLTLTGCHETARGAIGRDRRTRRTRRAAMTGTLTLGGAGALAACGTSAGGAG